MAPEGMARVSGRSTARQTGVTSIRLSTYEKDGEVTRVPPPVTTINLPDGKQLQLTSEQMAGAVAWKQGKLKRQGKVMPFYIMKYPDESGHYPVKNTLNTFDPIEGVVYAENIGSVAKSIIKKYGEIPTELRFDMGIQDVTISRDRSPGIQKPKIKFKLKKEYRTRHIRKARQVRRKEVPPSLRRAR
jgi:hypothetical protein